MLEIERKMITLKRLARKAVAFLVATFGVILIGASTYRFGLAGFFCSAIGLFSFLALMLELEKLLDGVVKQLEKLFSYQLFDGYIKFLLETRHEFDPRERQELRKILKKQLDKSVELMECSEEPDIEPSLRKRRAEFKEDILCRLEGILDVAEDTQYTGHIKKQLDQMAQTIKQFEYDYIVLSVGVG